MAGGYDGTIRIDSRIDSKGFNGGIRAMTGSIKGLAAAVGLAFGTAAVVAFGKTAVDAASEMASALTGLRFMLDATGRSFEDAKGFIDDYIQDGLVPASDAITAYKNLLARGYDDTQIKSLMNIMKDSAAFNRQAAFSMGEAIRKASEGLRQENSLLTDSVGITTNVAKMWDKYAASIGTTANNLTLAQKRQAEVNGFMAEGAIFAGAASTYLNTYAGRVSSLSASLYNMKVALGNAIIPILTKIIPYIKALVDWFVVLFNVAARVIGLFFNVDASMASAEAGAGGVADETQAAADAAGELAANTKKAGKEAKGALAAFDQINVLQQDTGSGAGAGAGTGGGLGLPKPEEATSTLDALKEKVEAFKLYLKDLFAPSLAPLQHLGEAISGLGDRIREGLGWVWENILKPFGEWVVKEVAPRFIEILADLLDILNLTIDELKPGLQWLWDTILKPIANWSGQAFIDFLDWWAEGLDRVKEAITQGGLVAGFEAAWKYIGETFKKITADAFNWVVAKWGQFGQWFNDNVTEPVKKWFSQAWEDIQKWAGEAWEKIKKAWKDAGAWFKTHVTDPVKNWFDEAWKKIKGFFTDTWKNIQGVWQGAKDWFKTNITDPIKDGFDTALDNIKDRFETTFNGIKDFVKGIINSIIDFINSMTSGIASGINGVVGALNAISVTVPAWVPEYGGKSFGFNLPYASAPQIPRLASGAVIPPNAQFAAILGDQKHGRNLEAPEGLIRQIIREEMGEGGGDLTVTMPVYLDSNKIYEGQKKVQRRRGRNLITGGANA
jgi:hypothetical protein